MGGQPKKAIVTGASQGIGAGIVNAFVERGFNVVANSRKVTQSAEVAASSQVALVDGHIGEPATADMIVETARPGGDGRRIFLKWPNEATQIGQSPDVADYSPAGTPMKSSRSRDAWLN
jgi:NAD(P)-dependent dehydrogenase (short-subunit alcohol dehydrogenase family)